MRLREITTETKKLVRERVALNQGNWDGYAKLFRAFIDLSVKVVRYPAVGPLLKRLVAMEHPERDLTQGYVISLNKNVGDQEKNRNVVLPIHVTKRAIEESTFRSILHKCLCRTSNECSNFDINFGCIFIGEGARSVVRNGIGREVSVAEALEHVDWAMDSGLVGMCLWMEAEKYIWGIKEEDVHRFLQICFCCPCCCIPLSNLKRVGPDLRGRFRPIGWRVVYREGCDGCSTCQENCPIDAITPEKNSVVISDECLGCGICTLRCPRNALEIEMISPQKESVVDYFQDFTLDV